MSNSLLIHSIFPTIQGEGPFVGRPAVFVRLGSCNLACPLCDTPFADGAHELTYGEILAQIREKAGHIDLVVITGGEPFQQPIGSLVRILLVTFDVQIETNGTLFQADLPYDDHKLAIVCSPKTPKVHPALAPYVTAYKYVVEAGKVSRADGLPSESFGGLAAPPARPPNWFEGPVYVQPIDVQDVTRNKANLDAAIASCLEFNHLLCLQTHKIIGME